MADDADQAVLPPNFWSVPEQFIADETLRFLHAEVCARLRRETPDSDTLEQMAMERVASLYFYMRDREMKGGLNNASAYKSIMSLWVTMATDLRKARNAQADADVIRAEVTGEVITAVKDALAGLEPEAAIMIQRRLRQSLGV